ncbi:hypothetical protein TI04_07830 [Achromatium sp. WMS2]|nr:hypothetical protein TI04_07830 [Achromatium sp. WMS2]
MSHYFWQILFFQLFIGSINNIALAAPSTIDILIDDFSASQTSTRTDSEKGAINAIVLQSAEGKLTATIPQGQDWGGLWFGLNHPVWENLPINFSGILPQEILSTYQSRIVKIKVAVLESTTGRILGLELKDGQVIRWNQDIVLSGNTQNIEIQLPVLTNINHLAVILKQANPGDKVVLDRIALEATNPTSDTATAAFVWSYGMLLNNWNPQSGLVRDKSRDPSGTFDAIQATGGLAAATVVAMQMGIITRESAEHIVNTISNTLLTRVPKLHGLWPHWVKSAPDGSIVIVPGTEWSSIDTSIAALCILIAQQALGLDTTAIERFIREIDWANLVLPGGISHGYDENSNILSAKWDSFGGESWIVGIMYASATKKIAPVAYPLPPTFNGCGFIDHLAWLVMPPPSVDHWGVNWPNYLKTAVNTQLSYYLIHYPNSCFAKLGLIGLSAAEVPDPPIVEPPQVYQAFGVGGRGVPANDGHLLLGTPVVVPHLSAMIASDAPIEAVRTWDWLINNGLITPLNNVESLMFPDDTKCSEVVYNHLKGSWNLTLQTLGLGLHLAKRNHLVPILYKASQENEFLQNGYKILALCKMCLSSQSGWRRAIIQ